MCKLKLLLLWRTFFGLNWAGSSGILGLALLHWEKLFFCGADFIIDFERKRKIFFYFRLTLSASPVQGENCPRRSPGDPRRCCRPPPAFDLKNFCPLLMSAFCSMRDISPQNGAQTPPAKSPTIPANASGNSRGGFTFFHFFIFEE